MFIWQQALTSEASALGGGGQRLIPPSNVKITDNATFTQPDTIRIDPNGAVDLTYEYDGTGKLDMYFDWKLDRYGLPNATTSEVTINVGNFVTYKLTRTQNTKLTIMGIDRTIYADVDTLARFKFQWNGAGGAATLYAKNAQGAWVVVQGINFGPWTSTGGTVKVTSNRTAQVVFKLYNYFVEPI